MLFFLLCFGNIQAQEMNQQSVATDDVYVYGDPDDLTPSSGNMLFSMTFDGLLRLTNSQIAGKAKESGFKALQIDYSTGIISVAAGSDYAPSPALGINLEKWVKDNLLISKE